MVISEDPWNSRLYCRAFGNGAVTTYFNDLGLSRWDSNTQPYACEANALTYWATATAHENIRIKSTEVTWVFLQNIIQPEKFRIADKHHISIFENGFMYRILVPFFLYHNFVVLLR